MPIHHFKISPNEHWTVEHWSRPFYKAAICSDGDKILLPPSTVKIIEWNSATNVSIVHDQDWSGTSLLHTALGCLLRVCDHITFCFGRFVAHTSGIVASRNMCNSILVITRYYFDHFRFAQDLFCSSFWRQHIDVLFPTVFRHHCPAHLSFFFPVRFDRLQSLLPLKCPPHTHTAFSNCPIVHMGKWPMKFALAQSRILFSPSLAGRRNPSRAFSSSAFFFIFNLVQLPLRDAEQIMCIFSIVLIHFILLRSLFGALGLLVVELLKSGVFETNVMRSLFRRITRTHRLSLHLLNNVILLWLIIIALLNV